jgi:hypothetical protein
VPDDDGRFDDDRGVLSSDCRRLEYPGLTTVRLFFAFGALKGETLGMSKPRPAIEGCESRER